MKKIIILSLLFFLLTGCSSENDVVSIIEKKHSKIAVNYPVTSNNTLYNEISSYVNKFYKEFKNVE